HRFARDPPVAARARPQGPADRMGPIHEDRAGPDAARAAGHPRGALGLVAAGAVSPAVPDRDGLRGPAASGAPAAPRVPAVPARRGTRTAPPATCDHGA